MEGIMALTAGISREIITPPVGSFLFGYNDHQVSNSVHDDLTVTALALESDGRAILLLSVTVCLVHTSLADRIRREAGAAAGIPAAQVILSATHTHSGPRTDGFSKWGSVDESYCEDIFIPKCIAVARAAMGTRKPVSVGMGTTESLVGINRRQLLRDNKVILGQNPWDMYDSTMTVIAFKCEDGTALANLVHVGAHCTAAGQNHEISRDWAGVMIDRLEEESGAKTLFFNGTAGDIAPRMANGGSTGDMRHAMELGGLAGIDAVRAYKTIRSYRDEPLAFSSGDITIPFTAPIPKETVTRRLNELSGKWSWELASMEQLDKLYRSGSLGAEALSFRQTVIRLGPAVFVPFPFETCTEIGFRLKAYSPFAHTLLLSCTNGSNSYLPAQSQLCRGGYEVDSFRWSRPRQLPDDTDRLLIDENLKLIEKL